MDEQKSKSKLSPDERRGKMRQLIGIAKLAPGEDLHFLKNKRLSQ